MLIYKFWRHVHVVAIEFPVDWFHQYMYNGEPRTNPNDKINSKTAESDTLKLGANSPTHTYSCFCSNAALESNLFSTIKRMSFSSCHIKATHCCVVGVKESPADITNQSGCQQNSKSFQKE